MFEVCAVSRDDGEALVDLRRDSEAIVGLRGNDEVPVELCGDSERIVGLRGNDEAPVEVRFDGGACAGLKAKEIVRGVDFLSAPLGLMSFCITGEGMEGGVYAGSDGWWNVPVGGMERRCLEPREGGRLEKLLHARSGEGEESAARQRLTNVGLAGGYAIASLVTWSMGQTCGCYSSGE